MSRPFLAVLLTLAAPSWAAERTAPSPAKAISAVVRFSAPKGWRPEHYANGADPVSAFVSGEDRIVVRVFGAPGSAYADPAAFLSGAAASTMGRPPEKAGERTVARRRVDLHQRGFPVNLGDPHIPSGRQQVLGREIFLILPASKGRFAVLSYARESPAPDRERRGEKAWEAFLKTVKSPGRKT
ncbi:MAG: hypothetical protein HYV14_00125 [Elusimicrobia bacterium]|nr:hypothetical protein [Elusimicrobiota bacterium]